MKSQAAGSHEVPGLQYHVAASKMVQNIPERATMELLEIFLLLAFYSHILNRRHSAYHFIETALRLGMTLGLQHNIPTHINVTPTVRQHRLRLWWSIYYCDRVWGSRKHITSSGLPFPCNAREWMVKSSARSTHF